MKKILLLIVIIIVLGVVLFFRYTQNIAKAPEQGNIILPIPMDTSEIDGSENIATSLENTRWIGKRIKCTYSVSDAQGVTISSSVITEGQKHKFQSEVNGEKSYGVFDGETQYMWSDKTRQGSKMTKACLDILSQSEGSTTDSSIEKPQDFEKSFDEAKDIKCEETNEDFSLPADIQFVDQCEMMQESLQPLENMKENIPAGVTIPGL